MEAFLVSTSIVALAEMGDKTQLLALVLAARYRKPWPIVLGILLATLFNHTLAASIGAWITHVLGEQVLRWVVGVSFFGMAAWTLIPDKVESDEEARRLGLGVFGTTLLLFFLVEMGDKTQLATVALAARYGTLLPVVAGTTLGMMIADVPAVFFGDWLLSRIPVKVLRALAAAGFAALGLVVLWA